MTHTRTPAPHRIRLGDDDTHRFNRCRQRAVKLPVFPLELLGKTTTGQFVDAEKT